MRWVDIPPAPVRWWIGKEPSRLVCVRVGSGVGGRWASGLSRWGSCFLLGFQKAPPLCELCLHTAALIKLPKMSLLLPLFHLVLFCSSLPSFQVTSATWATARASTTRSTSRCTTALTTTATRRCSSRSSLRSWRSFSRGQWCCSAGLTACRVTVWAASTCQ